jgi:hypothetical protein
VNRSNNLGPAWLLVALSALADLLGIFSFLGLNANRTAQIVAMIVLGLVAVAAAITQLTSAVKLSLSLRGAYYQGRALRAKIFGSLLALAVAVALVIGAAVLAFEPDDSKPSTDLPKDAASTPWVQQ